MNHKVTIIMCNYNTPFDKLEKAITSVFNQTYKDIHFIIVDDYSTLEGTREFYSKMQEKGNFELIWKPQISYDDEMDHNHGHSFCRNWALELVPESTSDTTNYVMFCDADDEMSPCAVELLLEPMMKDKSIDISVGNYTRDEKIWANELKQVALGNKRSIYPPIFLSRYEALFHLCDPYMIPGRKVNNLSLPLCATWNKIFKRELFFKENYNITQIRDEEIARDFASNLAIRFPDFKLRDDNFIAHWLIWNSYKIAYTSKITYLYRKGGQLADSNLYKTKDIIEAHYNRLEFFRDAYEENIWYSKETLTKHNYQERCLLCRAYFSEKIVYAWTLVKCIQHFENDKDKKDILELLKLHIAQESMELLNIDPNFSAHLVEFIESQENKLKQEVK